MASPVTTYAAAQLIRLVPRVRLSRAVRKLCEQPLPPAVSRVATQLYARAYDVQLDEAENEAQPYRSFDDFFTRRLRPGSRPIEASPFVSPSDGCLVAAGDVAASSDIVVKGRPYGVSDLCGSVEAGARYAQGEFAVIYLHPRDYHRVHSPVDGSITLVRAMPGDLYPVNAIGERHVPGLFVRNQRVAFEIETDSLGLVTVVMVGATIVGKISATVFGTDRISTGDHQLSPPASVARGDEIGVFHLGSTVVVLLQTSGRLSRATGPVRYGESLVRA